MSGLVPAPAPSRSRIQGQPLWQVFAKPQGDLHFCLSFQLGPLPAQWNLAWSTVRSDLRAYPLPFSTAHRSMNQSLTVFCSSLEEPGLPSSQNCRLLWSCFVFLPIIYVSLGCRYPSSHFYEVCITQPSGKCTGLNISLKPPPDLGRGDNFISRA